jgi:hypothetical protein
MQQALIIIGVWNCPLIAVHPLARSTICERCFFFIDLIERKERKERQ